MRGIGTQEYLSQVSEISMLAVTSNYSCLLTKFIRFTFLIHRTDTGWTSQEELSAVYISLDIHHSTKYLHRREQAEFHGDDD